MYSFYSKAPCFGVVRRAGGTGEAARITLRKFKGQATVNLHPRWMTPLPLRTPPPWHPVNARLSERKRCDQDAASEGHVAASTGRQRPYGGRRLIAIHDRHLTVHEHEIKRACTHPINGPLTIADHAYA